MSIKLYLLYVNGVCAHLNEYIKRKNSKKRDYKKLSLKPKYQNYFKPMTLTYLFCINT